MTIWYAIGCFASCFAGVAFLSLMGVFSGSGAKKKPEPQTSAVEAGAELAVKLFEDYADQFDTSHGTTIRQGDTAIYQHKTGVGFVVGLYEAPACWIEDDPIPLSVSQAKRVQTVHNQKLDAPKIEAIMRVARQLKEGSMLQ